MSSDDQSNKSAHGRGISSSSVGVCHTCLPLVDATLGEWDAEPIARPGTSCVSCGGRATLTVRAPQLDLVDIAVTD